MRAHQGTIFLDELGAVSPAVQARLLRVIEERKVRPVGSDAEKPLDVRIVAASRLSLEARVAEGAFRPDLYYRLSVVRVTLPSLRARREDIAPIVAELLRRRGLEAGEVEGPNLDLLMAHGWPGNVRELRNVVERALALNPSARSFADLRLSVAPKPADDELAVRADLSFADAKQAILDAFERRYLTWHEAGGDPEASGLRAAYLERSGTIGRQVRAELPSGQALSGLAVGIDADGRLLVRSSSGTDPSGAAGSVVPVAAADVVHLRWSKSATSGGTTRIVTANAHASPAPPGRCRRRITITASPASKITPSSVPGRYAYRWYVTSQRAYGCTARVGAGCPLLYSA
jgi:hypothetical protein